MTGHKRSGAKHHARNPHLEKRPSLTHFLCIPLVNSASITQLEKSLASFKEDYPFISSSGLPERRGQSSNDHVSRPLIPEGAIRPLGTLHLTLGVMSLPNRDRLDEAISFFKSLNLDELLREAERVALQKQAKSHNKYRSNRTKNATEDPPQFSQNSIQPLTASLESLHAIPRAKAATVLHASPVDSTARLYPFCLMLRDKFIEAGFITGDSKEKEEKSKKNDEASERQTKTADEPASPRHDEPDQSNTSTISDPYTAALARTPKIRPLLLHATILNTIYVRGRLKSAQGPSHTHQKRKNVQKRIEIDARGLLDRYKNYFTDNTRTTPRVLDSQSSSPRRKESPAQNDEQPRPKTDSSEVMNASARTEPQFPFIWAKDIPIDSVCICEMGAKRLPDQGLDAETLDLNKRLGEKYVVVAQRAILDSSS
ncbi:uncharacterized protein N7483_008547 [Penicillium malachiteum]|uniref:uncharacterized protein n=1 Tax=Penicillium malachiteum TaxID=1324776 RepID=UPI00254973C6|nr:uncharacterized protein N7483_008547 [Penicillium malachiteum]KAJ5720613.1 hypothetical protein N7483_008547 [Penicillium malachiteum]